MKSVAHVYPWDIIGDPGAVQRILDLGVDAVALAASYHTVRAATPLHPEHRLVDARHAALYVPVREQAWGGRRLTPAEPSWVDGPDSYGQARDALKAAGLPVYAWTVLTHSSRLGDLAPEVVVRNAFGDRYPYALCTAQPEVVEYALTLVREIVEQGQPDGVVLEACGPLGFFHGGHHEKTEGGDWGKVRQALLSICFCTACAARCTEAGIEVDTLRAQVRNAVDAGEPDSVESALGAELASALAAVRTSVVAQLRALLVGEVRELAPQARVIVHASADPWATGPFATAAPELGVEVDAVVAMCWPGPEASIPGIEALRKLAPGTRIAGYVLALPPKPIEAAAMRAELAALAAAGVQEFHLYHAGLASGARLAVVREALDSLGQRP
ncbi:hypothetical protein N8J89_10495 [Crossiella sp. CA-258035]|uniref:hypothetical protein n=1 Tax=Crossiella sp. CA-258035 TaxID=2981138 RepID=UPI0024BC8219|nr:hypothetical protein [Crossiella sp. CA-258035]WHT21458.1 hypothetical protein N8J89_10495 [Crossiella sp. CA-258035]